MNPSVNPAILAKLKSMGLELIGPGGAHFMLCTLLQKLTAESNWQETGHQLVAGPAYSKCQHRLTTTPHAIVAVGEQIYVDSYFSGSEDPSLRFFVLHSTLKEMPQFSGVFQYLVQTVDFFKRRVVVELGSADGHASMVAKSSGAKKVIAIECDVKWKDPFWWNQERYQVSARALEFWCEDFTKEGCIERISKVAPQVMMANIGPLYPCHDSLINLVCALPSVRWFIAAGYLCPDLNKEGIGKNVYPNCAFNKLGAAGFQIVKQVAAVPELLGFKDEGTATRRCPTLAFVAQRS